jgi:hypothetical protein
VRLILVHVADEYDLDCVDEIYPLFDAVFRNYWSPTKTDSHVFYLPLGTSLPFASRAPVANQCPRASQRNLWCNFIGNSSPRVFDEVVADRAQMLDALAQYGAPVAGRTGRADLRATAGASDSKSEYHSSGGGEYMGGRLRQLQRGDKGGAETMGWLEAVVGAAERAEHTQEHHQQYNQQYNQGWTEGQAGDQGRAQGERRRGASASHSACHVCVTDRFNNQQEGLGGADYVQVLTQAVFTPCPSGSNEESYRIWEALEAGSIPIIKKSRAWKPLGRDHPLPMLESWDELPQLLEALMFNSTSTSSLIRDAGGDLRSTFIDTLQEKVRVWWSAKKRSFQARCARQLAPVAAMECTF